MSVLAQPPWTDMTAERNARILILLLGVGVLYALLPFISGFIGATVLAIAARPAYESLSRHVKQRPAAVIVSIGALLLVLVPGVALTMSLLTQAPGVARTITESPLLKRLGTFQLAGVDVGAFADSAVSAVFSWVSGQAVALVGGLTLATVNTVVAVFGLYYLLIDQGAAWRGVSSMLPFSRDTLEILGGRFRTTTESMLVGIVLTALAQGCVVGVAFALVQLPNPVFWGFVTACASVLPILGSAIVWLPATLLLVADHEFGRAAALGAIGLVVASQVDNVIRLVVYRRISQIHPLVTLVGVFAGMRVFGLAGLLLGPLSITCLLELLRAYRAEYGARPAAVLAAD